MWKDDENGITRRGRRRRSSEYVAHPAQANDEQDTMASHGVPGEADASRLKRLWWQRDDCEESTSKGSEQSISTSNEEHARPTVDTRAIANQERARQASEGTAGSSQSPSIRSPAAAFLSTMNDMLASPSPSSFSGPSAWSPPSRGYSLSPTRSDAFHQQYSSMPDTLAASLPASTSSGSTGTAGNFGLAGAAAQLYNSIQDSPSLKSMSSYSGHHNRKVKSDDEGARIGPGGRYLLGKTIGFGGFSTVREAWDLGESVTDAHVESGDATDWHRVAVKIVYSSEEQKRKSHQEAKDTGDPDEERTNELKLWRSLPSHPNLLPLLYHEQIRLEDRVASGADTTVNFLVMPFCEGNLLTYVRTAGSLTDPKTASSSRSGSTTGAALERSASTRSAKDAKNADVLANVATQMRYARTGSGFIPHLHRSTAVGDRVVSAPLSVILNRSSSLAASPASNYPSPPSAPGTLLRSGSVRARAAQASTSRGLPMQVARDVICQITEAILCLHHKAGVLHGDLKLENVLGQQWLAHNAPSRSSSTEGTDEAGMGEGQSPIGERKEQQVADLLETSTSATVCWRVADFGLARKVTSRLELDHGPHDDNGPPLAALGRRAAHPAALLGGGVRRHSSGGGSSSQNRSHGGSLAYAAPEVFVIPDTDDGDDVSPYASDMWAFGCIVYALFAGRLPFADAFEPRLQSKIAQGRWDMPHRLRRRGRRDGDTKHDEGSANRSYSFGTFAHTRHQTAQPSPFTSLASDAAAGGAIDMSASMPSLPVREAAASSANLSHSTSNQSVMIADDSALLDSAAGVDDEDPSSDVDDTVDVDLDGSSKDRVAIRTILRGLLEPDARKRWTVRQLAGIPWISGRGDAQTENLEAVDAVPVLAASMDRVPAADYDESRQDPLASSTDKDIPPNFEGDLSRPAKSLVHITIPENSTPIEEDDVREMSVHNDEEIGRGRALRRGRLDDEVERSKPIDIDRSKSRSRSRVRDDSPSWGLDMPHHGGGFSWRQQPQSPVHEFQRHNSAAQSDSRSRPSSSARSSSVDIHSGRGRSSYGRNGGDGSSTGNGSSSSGRGGSRSRSRGRRADLDLIMPQLSLHRTVTSGNAGQGQHSSGTDGESREGSPAPTALQQDNHQAARSSIWKSPMRARDRLTSLMGTARSSSRDRHQTPESEGVSTPGSAASGKRRGE